MGKRRKLFVTAGVALLVLSVGALAGVRLLASRFENSVHTADLFADAQPALTKDEIAHREITGPLNLLLVGVDTRPENPDTAPLADSIMILHVARGLDKAYLISIPRDLIVDIPAWPRANYLGGREKINGAMSHGSLVGGAHPDRTSGFGLLAKTVLQYTGIGRFDAGAIIDFDGFHQVVAALGGVDMTIDERTFSEHLTPDGVSRWDHGGESAPRRVYEVGPRHLTPAEALDYVRQRKSLPDGDYGRQRHQQQFLQAMVGGALSAGTVTNPLKLGAVLEAAGGSLTFSSGPGGPTILDYAWAFRGIGQGDLGSLRLPGHAVGVGDGYQGELLDPLARDVFAAVQADTLDEVEAAHPDLVNR